MRSPEDKDRTLLDIIQEIVADQLNIDPSRVIPSANFTEDLGADSLDVVELVMSVEERFDMEIEDIVAGKIATVQDVLDYLIAKRI
jgi:acyl carrier protein